MNIKQVIRCVYILKQQPVTKFKIDQYTNFILDSYDCTQYVAEKVSYFFKFINKPLIKINTGILCDIILKENETIRNNKIVTIADRSIKQVTKSKKKVSKYFKQLKQLK